MLASAAIALITVGFWAPQLKVGSWLGLTTGGRLVIGWCAPDICRRGRCRPLSARLQPPASGS
jgi:hypothetical protein